MLEQEWVWDENPDGPPLTVREALYRRLEAEQEAAADAPASATLAERILSLCDAAAGNLAGLLAGHRDELLDREPGRGEWSLRQTLDHVLLTERRYREQVAYAVGRADSDPLRRDPVATLSTEERAAGVAGWLEMLRQDRAATAERLQVPDMALGRPTIWVGHQVDVRFRLNRFAAHVVEHTIQCEKILASLQVPRTEARRIVRGIATVRGLHQQRADRERLRRLDAALAATAATFAP
jgi:uncharacterized damage-inducible protein DinB